MRNYRNHGFHLLQDYTDFKSVVSVSSSKSVIQKMQARIEYTQPGVYIYKYSINGIETQTGKLILE